MTQVYLAGPFFSDTQLDRLNRIKTALNQNKTLDFVYVPMDESSSITEPEGSLEWRKQIYQKDVEGLLTSDIVVAIYDFNGTEADPGTMYEVGRASAEQMPIILVQEGDEPVNLMITESIQYYLKDVNELATLDFNHLPTNTYEGEVF